MDQELGHEYLGEAIEKAFSSVPYPGDSSLVSHSCLECEKLTELFKGRNRHYVREHLPEILQATNLGFISLLSPSAFRFFLPGFMMAIIKDYITAAPIIDSVVGHFIMPSFEIDKDNIEKIRTEGVPGRTPVEMEKLKEELLQQQLNPSEMQTVFMKRMSQFSANEIDAIRDFLLFLKAEHSEDDPLGDVDRALQSIAKWSKQG